MNRIHLIYPLKTFYPTHYLLVDYNQQNPYNYWRECIDAHAGIPKYLWTGFRDGHKWYRDLEPVGDVPNTTWIERCERHHYYMADNYRKRAESWHLPEYCTAFSGIGTLMQIAVQNGATEIYLLGCDLYVPDYRQNFFVENYTDDQRPRQDLDNTNMTHVHMVAKRSSPVPIFNCTFGGMLEVHERRDFHEVLRSG
jgi:hypothetical protein